MDDLEFRQRAFSNPRDTDPDFVNALRGNAARERMLDEITALEEHLHSALHAIEVPVGLADRLKQQPTNNNAATTPPAWRRYGLVAASLFVAVAVSLSIVMPDRPNAEDRALHNNLVEHLYHEEPRYAGDQQVSWEEVQRLVRETGGRVHDNQVIRSQHLKFANDCNFGNSVTGAHVVIQGEHGPVSVIFLKTRPVKDAMEIQDERFAGRIIPLQGGNLAIAGEKEESLDRWQNLATQSFEWSI